MGALNNVDNTVGVCLGGTNENGTGGDSATAASCWTAATTWTNVEADADAGVAASWTPTIVTSSLYDSTALGTTIGLDDSTMTAVVHESGIGTVGGFERTWQCSPSLTSEESLSEAPTGADSVMCGRFLPAYTK